MDTPFILAIDCGGTKCAMIAVEPFTGNLVHTVWRKADALLATQHPKHIFGGYGRSPEMLDFCFREMMPHLPTRQLLVATTCSRETIKSILESHGFSMAGYLLVDETHAVLNSENLDWGMVLSAGTGLIGMALLPDGHSCLIDAVGPLIGDWGSGYYIGHQFLRQAYRKQSFSHEPIPEMQAICKHLDAFAGQSGALSQNYHRLVGFQPLYEDRSIVASLCQVCDSCANGGSELAKSILEEAGSQIAESAIRAVHFSGLDTYDTFPLLASGTVLRRSDFVYYAFKKQLGRCLHTPDVTRAQRPQVCGQVVAQLKALNPPNLKKILDNFFNDIQQHPIQ